MYNFSAAQLADSMSATIDFYNEQVDAYQRAVAANPELAVEDAVAYDEAKISWSSGLLLKCNADNVSATSRLIGAWRCTGRSARCTSISTTTSTTAAADCTTSSLART